MTQVTGGPLQPNAPGTGWKIDSQQEQVGVGPDDKAGPGVLVRFTTGKQQKGTVWLPEAQYTPANVRAAVAAKAAALDAVLTMTG